MRYLSSSGATAYDHLNDCISGAGGDNEERNHSCCTCKRQDGPHRADVSLKSLHLTMAKANKLKQCRNGFHSFEIKIVNLDHIILDCR